MKYKNMLMLLMLLPAALQAQTLQECQLAAEHNYPMIRHYGLIARTTGLTVQKIAKGWLPQVSAVAQATLQSDVPSWPDEMEAVYQQAGLDMKGLRKDQYKIGIDVSQTLFDGGAISSQKDIAKRQGAVEEAQTEVSMYQVCRRVNELYFALLLTDEQLRLNGELQKVLLSNEKKLESMTARGTAAQSDLLSVRAERLRVVQQATNMQSQRRTVATMLSSLCGIEVKTPEKPQAVGRLTSGGQRPELKVADAQLRLADAQEKALDAALMPRLGVFAQGFYGYPGYNMFRDMMNRSWSWNGMVGARLSWNIGALYTRRNDKARIQLRRDMAENSRDVFLFNNRLEQLQQSEDVERYRRLTADDAEIIALRSAVRRAAESKLAHGIIDVNDLVKEINAENSALVQQSIHETEMLKEMYNLLFTSGVEGNKGRQSLAE